MAPISGISSGAVTDAIARITFELLSLLRARDREREMGRTTVYSHLDIRSFRPIIY